MNKVVVNLEDRSYNILIGRGLVNQLPRRLATLGFKKFIVLTNKTLARLYQKKIESLFKEKIDWVIIPDGERYKTLATVEKVYHQLIRFKADRKTGLICLGGGVVGDIGGFVAATYMRGIPFYQIPTTLLAMVDSSVGGKTGVDLPSGKNLVGAFYQPQEVLIDINFLKTLPQREFVSGMAEVIKYGCIVDKNFFDYLLKNSKKILQLHSASLIKIISRSCEIKADVVSRDEKEGGLRAILNFGHTVGHAIETVSGYRSILHGEAIAKGMIYAAELSEINGWAHGSVVQPIMQICEAFGLSSVIPKAPRQKFLKAITVDKKASEGKIKYIAIEKIGTVREIPLLPRDIVMLLP